MNDGWKKSERRKSAGQNPGLAGQASNLKHLRGEKGDAMVEKDDGKKTYHILHVKHGGGEWKGNLTRGKTYDTWELVALKEGRMTKKVPTLQIDGTNHEGGGDSWHGEMGDSIPGNFASLYGELGQRGRGGTKGGGKGRN